MSNPLKSKILFLVQLPPPIHGASLVNQSIKNSTAIADNFSTKFINISPAEQIADIGKMSFRKLIFTLRILVRSFQEFPAFRPKLTYMTLSPSGLGLFKDGLLAIGLKSLGARLVIHLHGKGIHERSKNDRIMRIFYSTIFRNTDVIHLSEKLVFDVEQFFESNRIHIVNNGISSPNLSSVDRSSDRLGFLYLSNLKRDKGSMDFLNACALLNKFSEKFSATIVGRFDDTDFENEFRQRLSEIGQSNISLFDEGAYGDKKNALLQQNHIMVLPTYNDCFPLALIEAMAAHMAIISTDEGAIPDIVVSGQNGLLADKHSPSSLAGAMQYFINDPAIAQQMGETGYQRYRQHYTFEIFERSLVGVLQKIADRK